MALGDVVEVGSVFVCNVEGGGHCAATVVWSSLECCYVMLSAGLWVEVPTVEEVVFAPPLIEVRHGMDPRVAVYRLVGGPAKGVGLLGVDPGAAWSYEPNPAYGLSWGGQLFSVVAHEVAWALSSRSRPWFMGGQLSIRDFWRIVSACEPDGDFPIETCIDLLMDYDPFDSIRFHDLLIDLLFSLDSAVCSRDIPAEDLSSDGLLYSRCLAIARGQGSYADVLRGSSPLPDMGFESLLSVAPEAYMRLTGDCLNHERAVLAESFSNREGWG